MDDDGDTGEDSSPLPDRTDDSGADDSDGDGSNADGSTADGSDVGGSDGDGASSGSSWRDVDDDVGLSDEPWWEAADDAEDEELPAGPDDERWHERDGGEGASRPVRGLTDLEAPSEHGLVGSLGRAQRLAIVGVVGLAVVLALLSLAYVWILTGATGPQVDPPQASFETDYDTSAAELTLRHQTGDPVALDRVVVTVDGQRHDDWSADLQGSTTNGDGPADGAESSTDTEVLTSGDAIVVESVPPGSTVELQWLDEEGDVGPPIATVETGS